MNKFASRGLVTVWVCLLLSLVLWGCSKFYAPGMPADICILISQLTSIIATILLAFTVIMSSRVAAIERFFGGTGETFRLHKRVALWAIIFSLQHVIFLILRHLVSGGSGVMYVIPNLATMSYFWGILAFWFFLFLVISTIIVSFPYHLWKSVHGILSVGVIALLLHLLLITSDLSRFFPLKLYLLLLLCGAVVAFVYKVVLYKKFGPSVRYQIKSITTHRNVVHLVLQPESSKMNWLPGQFAFLEFTNSRLGGELHPFSMISDPESDELIFAIKQGGDFTDKLGFLTVGETVIVHGPYGNFGNRLPEFSRIRFIAAGIGIAPFLSFLATHLVKEKKVIVWYTTKTIEDAAYLEEIQQYGITVHHRESSKEGRITARDILANEKAITETYYLLCGPNTFNADITAQLIGQGVPKENIDYEDFTHNLT